MYRYRASNQPVHFIFVLTFLNQAWPVSAMTNPFTYANYALESYDMSKLDHLPKLKSRATTPAVIFFGTSILEDMNETGEWKEPNAWPSGAMVDRKSLRALNREREARDLKPLYRIGGAFNASCGGDRIENMLYRLTGKPNWNHIHADGRSETDDLESIHGLRDALLKRRGDVKLWVVEAGTNNVDEIRGDRIQSGGLKPGSIFALRELLLTIFNMSSPGTLVLLSGIHYRWDASHAAVDRANEKFEQLAVDVANIIEVLDRERLVGIRERAIRRNSQIQRPSTAKTIDTEEELGRYDSAISGVRLAYGHSEASDIDPVHHHNSLMEMVQHAAKIVELEKCVDRFDWATMTVPSQPEPRIEFLPVPETMTESHYDEVDGMSLTLEGYRKWAEVLFPKVREMLDRAESL